MLRQNEGFHVILLLPVAMFKWFGYSKTSKDNHISCDDWLLPWSLLVCTCLFFTTSITVAGFQLETSSRKLSAGTVSSIMRWLSFCLCNKSGKTEVSHKELICILINSTFASGLVCRFSWHRNESSQVQRKTGVISSHHNCTSESCYINRIILLKLHFS